MRSMLPDPSLSLPVPTLSRLITHGVRLHIATIWGSLRASENFRKRNPRWKHAIARRFMDEYGLNLLLLLAMQVIIFVLVDPWWVGEIFAILLLPFLSIIQVIIDRYRTDSVVFYDESNKAGLSVRVYDANPESQAWAFFNHFALPVGQAKGVPLRRSLHAAAQEAGVNLLCHAQNEELARYYLEEMEGGINLGGERPLLLWQYGTSVPQEKQVGTLSKMIGLHSLRNSGQIPKSSRRE